MILARSGDSATVLASVEAAVGVGGVAGAVMLSIWGGSKRRIHGLLLGQTLARISGIIIGLGGYCFPLLRNTEKIVPDYETISPNEDERS